MAQAHPENRRPTPATHPEHSEAYWQTAKYLIIALAVLMVLAVVLAVIVALRVVPWS